MGQSPVGLDTGAQQGDGQKADSQLSRGRRGQCQGWGVLRAGGG